MGKLDDLTRELKNELAFTHEELKELERARRERDRVQAELDQILPDAQAYAQIKERTAGVELDAHRRADELLAQTREEAGLRLSEAQSRAEDLLNAASAQASDTVAQAQARREELLREAEEQIERSVRQCGELFETCERITAHITGELRKLDVANAQLPIGLGSLKSGLAELRDQARER